jgi:ribose transport system permease protein
MNARTTVPTRRAVRRPDRRAVLGFLESYALLGLLALVFAIFSLNAETSASFPTATNIRNVLGNEAVLGILALASIFPLIAGQFDLSVGAVASMSSIACAAAMSKHGYALMPAVAVGIGLGALVGLMNGMLVAKARVNAFITTLGTATVIGGLITLYTDGQTIVTGISPVLTDLGAKTWLGIPRPAIILLAVALLTVYVLGHTPFGRHLHFVGSNAGAARLVGLNVDRVILRSFVISGTLAGAAGALLVARTGNASPQSGADYMLAAVSAAFLGATAIRPGRFNVAGTLVAVFFLAFSINGLNLAGVAEWINPVFNGGALVIAVAVSAFLGRQRLSGH